MAANLMRQVIVSKRRLLWRSLSSSSSSSTTTTVCKGGRVRQKMPESEVECRIYRNLYLKLRSEIDGMEKEGYEHDDDGSLQKRIHERFETDDVWELKSLLKDIRKMNRRHGVVPPRLSILDYEFKYRLRCRQFGTPVGNANTKIPGNDDPGICEMGRAAVEQYNEAQNSALVFVSVLQVEIGCCVGDYDMVVQARDPAVSSVPLKLLANCYLPYRQLDYVILHRPGTFAEVLRQNEAKESSMSRSEIEPLLYANLHNCPVINQRLGLRKRGFSSDDFPGSLVKVSLDDHTLATVAESTLNQRPNVQFRRAVGAWKEIWDDGSSMYHLMLEALEGGVVKRLYAATLKAVEPWLDKITDASLKQSVIQTLEGGVVKRFYAAISVNAEGEGAKLVDLVSVNSPRATMK